MLDAVTEHVSGSSDRTIEPLTNYAVLRAQQDFRDGESSIGLIATAVNRSLDAWSEDYLRRDAYVAGAHFRHRFSDSRYQVSGSFVASRVAGGEAAIAATQRDNVHGYGRPDGPDRYDPTRTSLSGSSAELIFGKYGGGITRFETALERQSAGFEPNDLGYLQRADQQDWNTWAALVFQKPRAFYRRLQINGNQWNAWTTDGLPLQRGFNTQRPRLAEEQLVAPRRRDASTPAGPTATAAAAAARRCVAPPISTPGAASTAMAAPR